VERPDEVLPLGEVEAGLPAHAAVDLGKEGGGHLDAGDPAQVRRRGESGEIADDPAPKATTRESRPASPRARKP